MAAVALSDQAGMAEEQAAEAEGDCLAMAVEGVDQLFRRVVFHTAVVVVAVAKRVMAQVQL